MPGRGVLFIMLDEHRGRVLGRATFATGRDVHRTGRWDNVLPHAGAPPPSGHGRPR